MERSDRVVGRGGVVLPDRAVGRGGGGHHRPGEQLPVGSGDGCPRISAGPAGRDGGKALGLLNAQVPDSTRRCWTGTPSRRRAAAWTRWKVRQSPRTRTTRSVRRELPAGRETGLLGDQRCTRRRPRWGFFTGVDFDPSTLPTMTI
ncbi:hypothetical protein QJS66_17805 [Kocuria rhizophila]|nr:hypothetical protein QJS66_17805 [Kocuria rhizophila]